MITIQLNGKTREISLDEFLLRDIQDILADDIGTEADCLSDFGSKPETLSPEIIESFQKDI